VPNDLPVPSDLHERLLKVLRLAEEGVGGERENAQVQLDKLLRRHSLTMADLLDRTSDRDRVWLAYGDEQEMTVLHGLARSVLGAQVQAWCAQGELVLGFDVTRSQRAELEVAWDVYRSAWQRARQDILVAFLGKHRLFDEGEAAKHALTAATDYEAVYRRRHLMRGLEHVETPRKRVTGGER
jgi:hypothetical protein